MTVILFLVGSVEARAQETSWRPYQAFPAIFQRYTGLNGYEDLVLASDLLATSSALVKAEQDLPTLKLMRAVLDDPNVARALAMIHAGLDKPIQSPRSPDKTDEQTTYPEYAGFRRAARVLAMQEYVTLADGRVSKAIDTMRDGLRLGYVTQSDILISGLVGIAIDAIVLERMARHFDQMALKDCIQITAMAEEWLKLPLTAESVLTMEHRRLRNIFDGFRNDPQRLRTFVSSGLPEGDPESDSEMAAVELSQYVESGNPGMAAMLDQALTISDAEHRAIIVEFRKPAWQRKPLSNPLLRATMAHRLYGLLIPSYTQALDKFDIERAKMHLLAVHGLIRRFQWENNRLPVTLAELKRSDLITDPFTGSSLIYKPKGTGYELSSAGAPARVIDGTAASAAVPIYLPKQIP